MIQRIQTVWWGISVLIIGACYYLPLFEYVEHGQVKILHSNDSTLIYSGMIPQMILTLIAILLFKKRSWQIILGYLIIANLIGVCFGAFVEYKVLIESHPDLKVLPWVLVLLLPVVFQILAIRAVKKDEALIKSMDRLR